MSGPRPEGLRSLIELLDGETIAGITAPGAARSTPVDRVLDATGRYVLPGGADAHTHLDMPLDDDVLCADDFASGTIAAAIGGNTSIVDYATQERGGSLGGALDAWHARAAGRAVVDYGFHMIVSDLRPGVERELDAMVAAGVPSFKLWDPERSTTISAATHHSRVDYSAYEGRQVTGGPETVISRGRVIVDRGRFVGQPGAGAAPDAAAEHRPALRTR